jgi:catechol 2,3-dioxygenase-like lactoylglutathione lyase family enzyme
MGLERGHSVYVKEYQANCIFGKDEGRLLEFIIPDTNSILSKFNNGLGGIHHLAIETPDIKETKNYLDQELEIDFLESMPVIAGDLLINFLSPTMTRGIIIEFVQKL